MLGTKFFAFELHVTYLSSVHSIEFALKVFTIFTRGKWASTTCYVDLKVPEIYQSRCSSFCENWAIDVTNYSKSCIFISKIPHIEHNPCRAQWERGASPSFTQSLDPPLVSKPFPCIFNVNLGFHSRFYFNTISWCNYDGQMWVLLLLSKWFWTWRKSQLMSWEKYVIEFITNSAMSTLIHAYYPWTLSLWDF